eukprot:7379402-Prymnesium_polylepis.1
MRRRCAKVVGLLDTYAGTPAPVAAAAPPSTHIRRDTGPRHARWKRSTVARIWMAGLQMSFVIHDQQCEQYSASGFQPRVADARRAHWMDGRVRLVRGRWRRTAAPLAPGHVARCPLWHVRCQHTVTKKLSTTNPPHFGKVGPFAPFVVLVSPSTAALEKPQTGPKDRVSSWTGPPRGK